MRTRRPRALQLVRYTIQTTVAAYVLVIVIANTTGNGGRRIFIPSAHSAGWSTSTPISWKEVMWPSCTRPCL